ncbi:MAG TPA: sigma-54 dependent transcriptional regulator [Spirochaetota bacterium]
MGRILLVDDEANIITVLADILQDENHIVYSARTGREALDYLAKNEADLIFLDVWLPDMDGLEILEKIRKAGSDTSVIMMSGHGSIDIAVKATKLGAYDFLEKPLSLERVVTIVNNAMDHVNLRRENRMLKRDGAVEDEMIGNSPSLKEVRETIDRSAGTNARVFITGENGTGKELVARAIFRRSKRADKPFIKVNCAAIPEDLIESELFGHEKGSFTGAVGRRIGKFELAHGGTLFLDEICDMSMSAQAKVLRVLQEQTLERVGGNETINVDVRVIAATNVDVKRSVEEGRFREDLYFRLNVIPIVVPPLRERVDDIPLLVSYFLDKYSREHGLAEKSMSDDAMNFLKGYSWPGNVREIKNLMERISIMVPKEEVTAADLSKYIDSDGDDNQYVNETSSLKEAKEQFEKQLIIKLLHENEKNVSSTAKALGIERTNLYRKMKQYHIDVDRL